MNNLTADEAKSSLGIANSLMEKTLLNQGLGQDSSIDQEGQMSQESPKEENTEKESIRMAIREELAPIKEELKALLNEDNNEQAGQSQETAGETISDRE